MIRFQPQTARDLKAFFDEVCAKWDKATKSEREYMVNPEEPVVMKSKNLEYDQYHDEPEDRHFYFHVESVGGGYDEDGDGEPCGHTGAQIGGFEIGDGFYFNGRRHEK